MPQRETGLNAETGGAHIDGDPVPERSIWRYDACNSFTGINAVFSSLQQERSVAVKVLFLFIEPRCDHIKIEGLREKTALQLNHFLHHLPVHMARRQHPVLNRNLAAAF